MSKTQPNAAHDRFAASYLGYVSTSCEDGDCYPMPGMTEAADGGIEMLALMVDPHTLLDMVREKAMDPSIVRLAFGLDRTTRPNQGTTMSDVFVYVIVERGGTPAYGFVEYDGEGGQRQHDLAPGDFWRGVCVADFHDVVRFMSASDEGGD